jgi:hypothetical protein
MTWNELVKDAPKGGILNARILWTFLRRVASEIGSVLAEAKRQRKYLPHFSTTVRRTYWMRMPTDTRPTRKSSIQPAFFFNALADITEPGDEEALSKPKRCSV